MAHYSVLIVYRKGLNERGNMEYRAESEYFGEDGNMMVVKYFEATRKAMKILEAEAVMVWWDQELYVHVHIQH